MTHKISLGLSKTATNAQIKAKLDNYNPTGTKKAKELNTPIYGDFDKDILNFKPTIKKNTLCVILDNDDVVVGYYYENTL